MTKRAAIYVRVSSEKQGEADKASPQAQEGECRELCQRQGYAVIEVYRDIERYYVGKRQVEPSGTRADRPGYKRMLADARAGCFDVILAWREDRLYRGFRPMIDMSDVLEETGITIELARETFDQKMMGLKASIAKLELDAIKERTAMGRAARLKSGKMTIANAPYGYDYSDGALHLNEVEPEWIRRIWKWRGQGVGRKEIRRRLIEADAPQNESKVSRGPAARKYTWSLVVIDGILARDCYYTGIWTHKWQGVTYEFPVPKILDEETYNAVVERRQQWKAFPASVWLQRTLLNGYVYCAACGTKMGGITKKMDGKVYTYYKCGSAIRGDSQPGCCKSIRCDAADNMVWDYLWALLSEPGKLEDAISDRVSTLQAEERDTNQEVSRLEAELDEMALKRQKLISWALSGTISESDLETQLFGLDIQKRDLERELGERRLLLGNQAGSLMKLADLYRQQVRSGMEAVEAGPQSEAHAQRQFELRRKTIEALVKRVTVNGDKAIRAELELDLGAEIGGEFLPTNQLSSRHTTTPSHHRRAGNHKDAARWHPPAPPSRDGAESYLCPACGRRG